VQRGKPAQLFLERCAYGSPDAVSLQVHHHRHVGDVAAQRCQADVAGRPDVHLSHIAHAGDTEHVGHQRRARGASATSQSKLVRHPGVESIGADRYPRLDVERVPAGACMDRHPGTRRRERLERDALEELRPGPLGGGGDVEVEAIPRHAQSRAPEEPSGEADPVRTHDAHAPESRGTFIQDGPQRPQPVQGLHGSRAHILGAGLGAGEPGTVQEQDREAGPGEVGRGGASGGPGADHDGIVDRRGEGRHEPTV